MRDANNPAGYLFSLSSVSLLFCSSFLFFPWFYFISPYPKWKCHSNILSTLYSQTPLHCGGDFGRVPFKGYRNCCRLGPDAWDEGVKCLILRHHCNFSIVCYAFVLFLIYWCQLPNFIWEFDLMWYQPGPDSVGIFAISQSCSGVAARACGLVSLEPTKVGVIVTINVLTLLLFLVCCILFLGGLDTNLLSFLQIAEILKDRPSWFRDCRNLEIFTMFPAGNGGTIELIYTQVTRYYIVKYFIFLNWVIKRVNGVDFHLDVCPYYLGSSSGFLDPEIHYNFREWQSRGMDVFLAQ